MSTTIIEYAPLSQGSPVKAYVERNLYIQRLAQLSQTNEHQELEQSTPNSLNRPDSNDMSPHSYTANLENIPPMSHVKAHKRSPTTPLTPAQQPSRRRRISRNIGPPARITGSPEMIEMRYKNWLLERLLQHSEELVEFLTLERTFSENCMEENNERHGN